MKWFAKSMLLAGMMSLGLTGMASAAPTPVVDIPSPKDPVVQRAERTADTHNAMASYYRYSRYEDERAKEQPLTVTKEKTEAEDKEVSFEVKEIRVSHSKILSDEEITKAVDFKEECTMTLADLNAMVARINALYKEKKVETAEAVLPPQVVKYGIVYIRLVEGVYGKTELTGNHRIADDTILHRIHAVSGDLVNVEQLSDELRVYNSTNTYQIRADLVPGEAEGTSDLKLTLEEKENPISSFIFTDNAGQKESGRYRIGAYSEYRGIGGHDAALAVMPIWTRGIWGGTVMYDTPWGHHGTRAQVSYSRNLVDIIDGPFEKFDMKANSNDLAFSVTHPFHISPASKVDGFLELHRKWSDTEYAGMALADNVTRTVKAGMTVRSYDENGMWFALASVTGYKNDNRIDKEENNGSYYNAYLMRRQQLNHGQYLLYRLYGQYTAFKELPSTEQFSIGGMATVRGYKESALSGDKGWSATFEWGFPISKDLQTWRSFLFLDHGVVYNNYSVATKKDYLTSTGIGFEYNKGGWYGKAVLGIPLNDSGNIGNASPRVHFYLQRNI